MDISVIIPWHNAERWWPACEDSIKRSIACAGRRLEWEVVVVRDDESRGVAWARNEGLSRARGDWIAWVDADDEVTENWASAIAIAIEGNPEVDVIVFDYDDGAGGIVRWDQNPGLLDGRYFQRAVMGDLALKSFVWNKVCKRSFYEMRQFVEKGGFEDYDFWTHNVARIQSAFYVPVVGYRHFWREEGLVAHSGASAMWVRCAWTRFRMSPYKLASFGGLMLAVYHWLRVATRMSKIG